MFKKNSRLAGFEAAAAEWRSQILSAMIYPALLTAVAIASLAVLMNFVVPRFAQVFESTGLPMPLPTYWLLETSKLIGRYGWIALLALVAGGIFFRRAIETPAGRERWDGFLLRLPLVGELVRKAETARFARTMSTLVAGSVPLVQALGIVREVIGNRVMARSLERVAQGVKRGEGLAAPVRRTGVFPLLASHLLMVGEETGRLDVTFEQVAGIYDKETQQLDRMIGNGNVEIIKLDGSSTLSDSVIYFAKEGRTILGGDPEVMAYEDEEGDDAFPFDLTVSSGEENSGKEKPAGKSESPSGKNSSAGSSHDEKPQNQIPSFVTKGII